MITDNAPLKILWDENELWRAVQEKDVRYVGQFYYGVQSTGIYCKPTCPSRRPRRDQVTFFHSCEEAEAGGFRACKRCHPRQAISQNEQVELIRKVCAWLDDAQRQPASFEHISRELKFSPAHLQKIFKQVMGLTPHQYAAGKRLNQFKRHVKSGADLTSALYDAGYSSTSRLYEGVSERMGMTPAVYRQGGAGKKIHYAMTHTYLGLLLVAATDQGICSVGFGSDEDSLARLLGAEFPAAELFKDEAFLAVSIAAIVKYLEGSQPHLNLPLDLQATAFQLRVWEELRKIPYGETRTYAEVAEAIGRPKAARAVANACAANPVGLVTPCQRVVRSDGSLGGYRWGVERKRALLAKEQQHLED